MSVDRSCLVCRKPTKGKLCGAGECTAKWNAYITATSMPRADVKYIYEKHDGPEPVQETGDYRPPVRKPRTR